MASIDLGTNTFLLLVAEHQDGRLMPVCERETIVRLGKEVDAAGNLQAGAIQRGLACLQEYLRLARAHGATRIIAVGTSALRDAGNRAEFLQRVQAETGLQVHIISGETEARLTYLGALSNQRGLAEPIAVMDIGGGSTEIVTGTHEVIHSARSADIGSVRLTERFLHSDPVTAAEVAAVRQQARQAMRAVWPRNEFDKIRSLVGTAGTLTTLAAMAQQLAEYDPARIAGFVLSKKTLHSMVAQLSGLTITQRKKLPGLAPARADVILAGALILETFMEVYDFDEILVSDRGLRYGVLLGFDKQEGSGREAA
ncbi:MAG: Ppx/GppA family phosphatase [candidate division KSB1 bacterium]|nr:Ppx/GppA family phosphatase [candidate division KSB1 bacterium]